jgi:hypothetical protein
VKQTKAGAPSIQRNSIYPSNCQISRGASLLPYRISV